MSDLLLMASSPLRSLLSTPGLVACYLPYLQVAQSLTGQSLIDYSPAGNHAQLGSTAGADTNDPSWGTNALTFGGDDYAVSAFTTYPTFSQVVVASATDTTATQFITGNDWVSEVTNGMCFLSGSPSKLAWRAHAVAGGLKAIYDTSDTANNTVFCSTGTVASTELNLFVGTRQISPTTISGDTFQPMGMRYIGRRESGLYLAGSVYAVLNFSRAITYAEHIRLYNALKTILAGQGVSVA